MASSFPDLEKEGAGEGNPHSYHLHLPHDLRRRVRQFLKPDGRRVLVVPNPEEETKLRRHLSVLEPNGNFDVYIHGSAEHVSYPMTLEQTEAQDPLLA